MRYFITFACYGAHLHEAEAGSVDRHHNLYGGRTVEADEERASHERLRMKQGPFELDSDAREVVLESLKDVCLHRESGLLAAHVRTNHVHVVVEAEVRPEMVMNTFKSYSSRGLNRLGGDAPDQKRWARHGSTRWLWKDQDVREAIRYVVEDQGEPMAVFVGDIP